MFPSRHSLANVPAESSAKAPSVPHSVSDPLGKKKAFSVRIPLLSTRSDQPDTTKCPTR